MRHHTLISVQVDYVDRVNRAFARWSHRKGGGQSRRTFNGARRELERRLATLGLTPDQIKSAVIDAQDMALLERLSEEA